MVTLYLNFVHSLEDMIIYSYFMLMWLYNENITQGCRDTFPSPFTGHSKTFKYT